MVARLTSFALAVCLISYHCPLPAAESADSATSSAGSSQPATEPSRESSEPAETAQPAEDENAMDLQSEASDVVPVDFEEVCVEGCQEGCGPVADGCHDSGGSDLAGLVTNSFLLDAWIAQGFTWNPDSPANRFNLPMTFNDRSNEYQLNQLYVSLGRRISNCPGRWDFGGQVDLLYGTDYFYAESNGLERRRDGAPHWNSSDGPRGNGAALYGLAMPQLFAEVYAPWGNGLTVKLGHFYTILGCESTRAPDNFFYSHSYVMQYGEPKTHTGLLGAYNITPRLTMQAGFTRGWDAWDGPNEKIKFLGGVNWTSRDKKSVLALAVHAGAEDAAGDYNRTSYSLVWSRALSKRMTYVLQHDLGIQQNAEVNEYGEPSDAKWYGVNNYLIYDLNCKTSLGLRFEWFRDQDNARVLALPFESFTEGGNYWSITFGMNWKPSRRITIRPECRWDWSDVTVPLLNATGMYDDFSDKNQFTLGTDVIVRY